MIDELTPTPFMHQNLAIRLNSSKNFVMTEDLKEMKNEEEKGQ